MMKVDAEIYVSEFYLDFDKDLIRNDLPSPALCVSLKIPLGQLTL